MSEPTRPKGDQNLAVDSDQYGLTAKWGTPVDTLLGRILSLFDRTQHQAAFLAYLALIIIVFIVDVTAGDTVAVLSALAAVVLIFFMSQRSGHRGSVKNVDKGTTPSRDAPGDKAEH